MQKNTRPLPDVNFVKTLLNYNPKTGEFTWRISSGKAKKESIAGCLIDGYRTIGIQGRYYRAHRLAWLIHYKTDPVGDLDHINGIRDDNRIANLRIASHSENMHNRRADHDNTSGIKGVCWNRFKNKWMSYVNGRHVGYFNSKEEAAIAVQNRRLELHGEFACNRV